MELTAEINLQNKLVPLYGTDYEVLKKLPKNTPLKIVATQQRNYQFHKKAMALFNLGFENQEKIKSFNNYRKIMVMKAGYYTTEITDKGVVYFAESLAYGSMDNTKFAEVYSRVCDVIANELDLTSKEIMSEISGFM